MLNTSHINDLFTESSVGVAIYFNDDQVYVNPLFVQLTGVTDSNNDSVIDRSKLETLPWCSDLPDRLAGINQATQTRFWVSEIADRRYQVDCFPGKGNKLAGTVLCLTELSDHRSNDLSLASNMVHKMAHDLRSPLRATFNLMGWIRSELSESQQTEKVNQFFSLMEKSLYSLNKLIDQKLSLLRNNRKGG